jgi:hypothetical protein
MRPLLLTAIGVSALLAGRLQAAPHDERYVFPVQPGCTLKLDSHRGGVFISESDDPFIRVLVQLEIGADTEADAAQLRSQLQLDVNQVGNVVSIFARNPSESRIRWIWREDRQIGLTYRITVPRRCNADIRMGHGNLTIGSLEGRVVAHLEKGTFSCRRVDGSCEATVDEGDIVMAHCVGPFRSRVNIGTIRAGVVLGALEARNSSGPIEVMMARGPVDAAAEAGDVEIGFPRRIGGDAAVTSRGGNVLLKIDPVANCGVEASAVWGTVTCRLPVAPTAGSMGKRRLTATLNAGGPSIVARASGGYVRLEPGETLFE